MGIDVYMRWERITEEEKQAQYTGCSIVHGHTGYLREAYHGEPYATLLLVPEAFGSETYTAKIGAVRMRRRLPSVLEAAAARAAKLYNHTVESNDDPILKSFIDFVELAERKEIETGEPVTVIVSY